MGHVSTPLEVEQIIANEPEEPVEEESLDDLVFQTRKRFQLVTRLHLNSMFIPRNNFAFLSKWYNLQKFYDCYSLKVSNDPIYAFNMRPGDEHVKAFPDYFTCLKTADDYVQELHRKSTREAMKMLLYDKIIAKKSAALNRINEKKYYLPKTILPAFDYVDLMNRIDVVTYPPNATKFSFKLVPRYLLN